MNKVFLTGRLTKDPDIKENVTRYTLAVDRAKSTTDPENNADFISCVCFGKPKEFADKHLKQGKKMLIEGRIQTGSYTNQEGKRIYTTDVIVDRHEFCESKRSDNGVVNMEEFTQKDFMAIPDGFGDGELPFD